MGSVRTRFYEDVLRMISAPINGSTMRACVIWQRAEGGSAHYNPWNTTQWELGAVPYNTFGDHHQYHVWSYADEITGIRATVSTLRQHNFEHIVQEFRIGKNGLSICQAVDHSAWGTHGAESLYRDIYGV